MSDPTEAIPDDILMHACCGDRCMAAESDRDGICERWAFREEAGLLKGAEAIAIAAIEKACARVRG